MSTEILSSKPISAASFSPSIRKRQYLGTDIVISLLKKSTEENFIITVPHIVNAYLDFTFYGKETVCRTLYWDSKTGYNDPRNNTITRDDMAKRTYYVESNALRWFKNNLGLAILRGRLLAIPIIDIDHHQDDV